MSNTFPWYYFAPIGIHRTSASVENQACEIFYAFLWKYFIFLVWANVKIRLVKHFMPSYEIFYTFTRHYFVHLVCDCDNQTCQTGHDLRSWLCNLKTCDDDKNERLKIKYISNIAACMEKIVQFL
jgi:hypothetical protein